MQIQNVNVLISEADQLLDRATKELQHSTKNFTAFLVCQNSKQSINNCLASYLLKNNIEINEPASIASLMGQCNVLDARFELINISKIFCHHDVDGEEYCLDFQKVQECLQIAHQVRDIV